MDCGIEEVRGWNEHEGAIPSIEAMSSVGSDGEHGFPYLLTDKSTLSFITSFSLYSIRMEDDSTAAEMVDDEFVLTPVASLPPLTVEPSEEEVQKRKAQELEDAFYAYKMVADDDNFAAMFLNQMSTGQLENLEIELEAPPVFSASREESEPPVNGKEEQPEPAVVAVDPKSKRRKANAEEPKPKPKSRRPSTAVQRSRQAFGPLMSAAVQAYQEVLLIEPQDPAKSFATCVALMRHMLTAMSSVLAMFEQKAKEFDKSK